MKKRLFKALYLFIKGTITLGALYIFKKYIQLNDTNFVTKMLMYSAVVLLLFALNHWIFMRVIFAKDNNKSQ